MPLQKGKETIIYAWGFITSPYTRRETKYRLSAAIRILRGQVLSQKTTKKTMHEKLTKQKMNGSW